MPKQTKAVIFLCVLTPAWGSVALKESRTHLFVGWPNEYWTSRLHLFKFRVEKLSWELFVACLSTTSPCAKVYIGRSWQSLKSPLCWSKGAVFKTSHLFSWQQLGLLRLTEALREVLSLFISHLSLLSTVSGLPVPTQTRALSSVKKKKKSFCFVFPF